MKLVRADQENLRFEMGRTEKILLQRILRVYPLVPMTYHKLSQENPASNHEENQRLLEEALSAERQTNRQQIESLLKGPKRFELCAVGYQVCFNRIEIEWLLQVINDVRIGSWLAAGSPLPEAKRDAQPSIHTVNMDLAAYFEMCLLRALSGSLPSEHD